MWGINHSLTTLQHVKPRAVLLKDDFKAYLKIKVKGHLFNKTFGRGSMWTRMITGVSSKSGSKLLVTYNRHYVLKMISSEEVEQMHHFIESYHEYIVNVHGQTLLPQYLGMYRITVNDQETYLLAMRNVFSPRVTVHRKYDLKPPLPSYAMVVTSLTVTGRLVSSKVYGGSVVDREANEKEKSKPLPTLKDNDFVNDICELHLEEPAKQRLMEHLERDIAFLQENNLMDYSALIGIHDVELAVDNDLEEGPGTGAGYFTSASPVAMEMGSSVTAGSVGVGCMGGHRGSGAEMLASAGDGLGEIFEERLFGPSNSTTASFIPSSFPMSSFHQVGGGGGGGIGLNSEPFSDFSPPNSDTFDTLVAGGSAEEGNYTPPESPSDDISHRFQPYTGDLNPISEFYAFRGSPSLGRPVIYFIALIDILTRYGMRKRTAQTYKTVKHGGANADQITTHEGAIRKHPLKGVRTQTKPPRAYIGSKSSPKEVKAGVDALKTLFKKRASIYSEYLRELYALEFKYARLYAPIYLQQRAIVAGRNVEDMEEDESPVDQKTLGDAKFDASLGSASGLGIPGFWARVLRTAPLMRNYLTEMDLDILQYLEGIRYSFSKKLSSPGFRLVFMFKRNPFFNDNVLMKQFSLKFIDQCEDLNEFGPIKVISTKASQIDWTSAHEPNGDVAVPPKDSFFNLFRDLQPESPDAPEYAQLMEDYDVCVYIRDRVLPYAVYWFTERRIN
ncbi:Phosphatidylinositol 5-phosphate 4-kinase type-2 beta [Taenia crassiceps]|uniref:Phosphatidylinositol 5-phosphate 4-kinase type-2 beta n=1 Tax=Taenia crassiceps TaxID=6207 RepID=A0ABR4Q209_9CEST